MSRDLRAVCVFCGSSFGSRPAYGEAARAVGRLLAGRGIALVYGGSNVGLMGAAADACLAAGGRVTGVIPRHLVAREVAHPGLTELRIVESMHERKALMADLADAFLALPGGFGTFDELFETLSWSQLGLQRKPSGVLNIEGYFDATLRLVDCAVAEGFVRPEHRALLLADTDPENLLDRLAQYQAPAADKFATQIAR
ncbi:MAG TPA: TIGR00730 family Rossman fold protein [Bryobacteraceae bacterium]|nr:TIGR00730 family Rossman fold protein [Bryobacteraceae bacterium]